MKTGYYALTISILTNCLPEKAIAVMEDGNNPLHKRSYMTQSDMADAEKMFREGMTYRQIGEIYGLPRAVFAKRLQRYRDRVKEGKSESDTSTGAGTIKKH
jgi:hypothetical protein